MAVDLLKYVIKLIICVCVCGSFESIFQHIAIVQSFDAISSHKNVKKILADILWSFF